MGRDDSDWKAEAKAVPELRFLKTLVTGLALVMGMGMIAVVALLWLRLGQPVQAEMPELPDVVQLPDGASPAAVTFARDWLVVVTEAGEILLYDRAGVLRGRIEADQAP
ncbi:DUF6476 family protein [Paracoccus sp. NSM]|uniref:DUF6476 family protein n=1 Tax=Paracoccus sp. NSM TaxID=3457784 RepID=UPI0040368B75